MSNNIYNQITLCDGRGLGFAEFGDLQGRPVFYFHGFPGSRLEAKLAEKISLDTHVRFIGIDRPGYEFSSVKPARTFFDWPDDVAELADALGVDRFSILGVSGGGPYAAACRKSRPSYTLFRPSFSEITPSACSPFCPTKSQGRIK